VWMACAWGVSGEMQNADCRMQNEGGGGSRGHKVTKGGAFFGRGLSFDVAQGRPIAYFRFPIEGGRGQKVTEGYTFCYERALGLADECQIIAECNHESARIFTNCSYSCGFVSIRG
jgi:hypothetical protein